ncbi:MAG: VWA domain-containing protein, partial [bacterium]
MRRLFITLVMLIVICACCLSSFAQTRKTDSPSNLLLILDASGSMWGQIEGKNKIMIARQVLKDLLGELPEQTNIGLVAYGHRSKGDCEDIETVTPLGPVDKAALSQQIDALNPKGKTPITGAIQKAFEAVRSQEDATTIILVSDGLETCGGDPCKIVADAKKAGVNFVMHVVGFDVGDVDVSQLECTAQAGGGLYFSAKNANELASALDQTVAAPAEMVGGFLSIKAMVDGKLEDVVVKVFRADTGEEIASGRTYSSPQTNPRLLPLPAGNYNMEVRAIRFRGSSVQQKFSGIEIAEGDTIEKVVDFSTGELAIKVTRNGALSDATVNVYRTGTRERVTGGRTYKDKTTNPAIYRLTPGAFDIAIGSVELSSKPKVRIEGVVVEGGKRIDRSHEFASGTLRIGAVLGSELVDATVYVRSVESGKPVGQGRTYTSSSSNPRTFELPPGKYRVQVGAVKLKDLPKKVIEVTVIAGQV